MFEVNIRHLFHFLECIRLGSVTAAAHSVGRSQPAITHALKSMEGRLNAKLLHRGKTGVSPTQAGEILSTRAQNIFERIHNVCLEISDFDKTNSYLALSTLTNAQVNALIATTQNQNFTAAANALGIATPTLHRAARELERNIGAHLFEQTSFGVRPTKSALKLANAIGLGASEFQQAQQEIVALHSQTAGQIKIGAMPLARAYLVPKTTATLSEQYPDSSISIVEGPYEDLLSALRRGALDCLVGAGRSEGAKDIIEEHLFTDQLSILMRPNHPLAKVALMSRKDLHSYPWVAPRQSSPLYQQFISLLGRPPKTMIECNSFSSARIILMNGLYLMLLSEKQARVEMVEELLIARKPSGKKMMRSIELFYRHDWTPTKFQEKFLSEIRLLANAQS